MGRIDRRLIYALLFLATLTPLVFGLRLPLYVTEGPLKTLALLQCGLAAVGISGVYGMHDVEVRRDRKSSEEDGWVLRPDLARLVMQGRQIALVWDSDIDTNENVLMAATKVARSVPVVGAVGWLRPPRDAQTKKAVVVENP